MHTRRQAAAAAAAFAAITIAWTWPLALGLARDLPADFGDPLLNAWVLAWDATHLGRGWWNANIFFPHPLALAYSEHLLPQALTILPVYAVTRNPILCYNLVFLATFVLSGLGMFLLARELTGRADAAFVAGLAFAFAPYRVASLPHVQVLSSEWMPFALYGFRRYFVGGRRVALAGGAAAWLLQNLSCGYYLLFFSPVMIGYVAWESIARRRVAASNHVRYVRDAALACVAVGIATAPFVLPYLELRRLGFPPRPIGEVIKFSADTFAYFTADPNLRLWGPIARAWSAPEGSLFPGLTIVVLAIAAAVRAFQASGEPVALVPFAIVLLPLLAVRVPFVRLASISRTLVVTAVLSAAVLAASRAQRRAIVRWLASPVGFFSLAIVFAAAMSLGPEVHARGRLVADGVPYALAYRIVPGYDGVRVPARFAMVVAFALAALTACAVRSRTAAGVAGVLVLVESLAVPIPINQNDTHYTQPHLVPLAGRVSLDDRRALDDFLAHLPPSTAVVELPLGEPAFDVRYMIASTRHWKPLVNGYSGGAPADYVRLDQDLQDALVRPDRAWTSLVSTGATHVVVHEAFYTDARGAAISGWLRAHGAHEVAAFGTPSVGATTTADRVLELK
ncbi:MAG TPA: hypothetical protein VFA27_15605 [Vicinamibacterales bacterium]|nr:hypothetical protein [Vicinamibacterales bacterium]